MKTISLLFIIFQISINAQITFDADFESGNIQSVEEIDSVSFNVTTKEDIGGRWFYFRMSGVKNKEVRIRITNSDVKRAFYSYDNKTFRRFSEEESGYNIFIKRYDADTVFVAYYAPYTFGYLQKRINEWKKNKYVSVDTIGFTENTLPVQEMIITDNSVPSNEKKTVWIHARTHPGETPSSWHFDGIVQELLSNKNLINYYLKKIEFHLIPFVNPDGVFYGRSRTNFNGVDVESNWDKTEANTCKEVKILRKRMKELNDIKPFDVFLNLHSQVSSFCTFWIHTPESTSESFYHKENLFAYLNISDNDYFEKADLRFSHLKSKFPEGWLWNNYGEDVMALTYETPYDNYFRNSTDVIVTNKNLFEIGARTVYAITEYLQISSPEYYLLDNSVAALNGNYSIDSAGIEFYGNNFISLNPNDNNASANYSTTNLPEGKYDVYAWWQANDSNNSYETKFEINTTNNNYSVTRTQKTNGGQWNYLTSVDVRNETNINIILRSNSTGNVIADAFRIIYAGPILSINKETISKDFILYQNYPNPFNPTTTIKYSIPVGATHESPQQQHILLKVYNILGEEVATLVNRNQKPGNYKVTFDAAGLASGTYIYRLHAGNFTKTKKMLLLK